MGRRPVLELTAVAMAAEEPRVTIRRGVRAWELLTGASAIQGSPHVIGVQTTSGEIMHADLVVDAMGRRSHAGEWIKAVGGRSPHEEHEDNTFLYYTRYFTGLRRPRRLDRALTAERRHARDAVHRAVVHLDVDGEASLLQPFDESVLPQRAAAVERDRVQLRDQGPQLLHAAGLRQGGVADVVVEVQLVFDHPSRLVDAERRRLEATAIRRQEIEPRRRVLAEAGEEIVLRRLRLKIVTLAICIGVLGVSA